MREASGLAGTAGMLGVTFRCERTPMAEPAPRPIDDTDDDMPSAEAKKNKNEVIVVGNTWEV